MNKILESLPLMNLLQYAVLLNKANILYHNIDSNTDNILLATDKLLSVKQHQSVSQPLSTVIILLLKARLILLTITDISVNNGSDNINDSNEKITPSPKSWWSI